MDLPEDKLHHAFISYYAREMDGVFVSLMQRLMAMGLNVFNQKRDLAGHDVSLELMQKHAAGSQLVLALLSPDYFTSKFCRGELEAAAAAGVPIVPVFSGEDYPRKTILALLDAHRDDPEKAAAVKAAFGENLIDANNGEHAEQVTQNLQEKIVERFLATTASV